MSEDFDKGERKVSTFFVIIIIFVLLIISFSVVWVIIIGTPIEKEDKFRVFEAEIYYEESLNIDDLKEAFLPLNYRLKIGGPYIKIHFNTSLADMNDNLSDIEGKEMRNGSEFSRNTQFNFTITSKDDNHIIALKLHNEYEENPFMDYSNFEILINRVAIHIETLIYQKTTQHGSIEIDEEYIGPVR